MSFVVTAALAVGLLVLVPIVAHLLRRGRSTEREFPPAALVPPAPPVARQRSRLEDRALLAARALVIAALALLGATPLVRCSRLSVARRKGASVALAVVLDDSLSMRAVDGGLSRWQRALRGARQLLASARDGDAVAIVLAGRPARLALAATPDLSAARRTLDELKPSDRSTDLDGALQMARAALRQLPQKDKRIVLLSDLAGNLRLAGAPQVWTPLPELHRTMSDCAVVRAQRRDKRVTVRIVCSDGVAAGERKVEVVAARPTAGSGAHAKPGTVLAKARLSARAGAQTVGLQLPANAGPVDARLTGADAITEDDMAPVAEQSATLQIGVMSDKADAPLTTGGPTVIEQALAALKSGAEVRPLTIIPDDAAELKPYAALLLDNPSGLSPETRSALGAWVKKGGVGLALLGPRAERAELGATLEPFARGAVHWVKTRSKGLDAASIAWLGDEAKTLSDLKAPARADLADARIPDARVAARWSDGEPFLLERSSGRGLLLTAGLPASVDLSDFPFRPGFIALIDYVIEQTKRRSGPGRSLVGSTWIFSGSEKLSVVGPQGPLDVRDVPVARSADCTDQTNGCALEKSVVPTLRGRYTVDTNGQKKTQIVAIDADEVTTKPRALPPAQNEAFANASSSRVDASADAALALLALFAGELVLRLLLRRRWRLLRRAS